MNQTIPYHKGEQQTKSNEKTGRTEATENYL